MKYQQLEDADEYTEEQEEEQLILALNDESMIKEKEKHPWVYDGLATSFT